MDPKQLGARLKELREQAGLSDRAVIVGCGDYIEIWDPARWERELASVEREMRTGDGLHAVAGDQ